MILRSQKPLPRRSEKPPKLPPRDNLYPHDIPKVQIIDHYLPCIRSNDWIDFNFPF